MSFPACQSEVAAFLQRLAGAPAIETHISGVFVGRADAWKLKKAVRLPYLDFTTIASRRRFLERELELNRPDAPDIYREVLAVAVEPEGGLVLRPSAENLPALDHVLRMAPVPADDFLDHLAASTGLPPSLQDAIADAVARTHARRAPVPAWDSAAALGRVADEGAESAAAAGLSPEPTARWATLIRAALRCQQAWLQRRADSGYVRRCHGDLHLGNLCLWNGQPTLFDALEFDESLATIDVGYDLAFLLMDLDQRVGRAAANRVMCRYLARTGDAALTHGLPLFLSLRAMIRAHVSAASRQASAANRYLAAALGYLAPASARVVAIGGLPGAGKSTLARSIAPRLGRAPGAVVVRSDELRKRLFGVAPEQRLPPSAYVASAHQRVADHLAEQVRTIAAGGQSVIADATFLAPEQRAAIAAAADAAGAAFTGVWLTAPPAVLEARIARRTGDASDADLAVLQAAMVRDTGAIDWFQADASDPSIIATVLRLVDARA